MMEILVLLMTDASLINVNFQRLYGRIPAEILKSCFLMSSVRPAHTMPFKEL